jgi:hypothetical protein
MQWVREGAVFGEEPTATESARAWRPWVLHERDGTLRMWYSASDGETSRILAAEQRASSDWRRLGVVVDAGFAGETDAYGVEELREIGMRHGYDPRGMGGFLSGLSPSLERDHPDRHVRRLTELGRKRAAHWRDLHGKRKG